jgi:hypothetical protein
MSREGSSIQRINGSASLRTNLILLCIALIAIFLLPFLGPAERSLGANVRVVYLHGAWVLAALAGFLAAGLAGAAALIARRAYLHTWSMAFGRTGLLFWITYLPLSLWAMQTNWNGLFLSEPRWRLALIFAVAGLLLQMGLAIIAIPTWPSVANLVFMVVLAYSIFNVGSVMHPPPSPIFNSGIWQVQLFFTLLFALTLLAAWLLARWFYTRGQAIQLTR